MIKSIKFVRVPTVHQSRAVAFWTQKFGFTVASDQPYDDSRRWVELRIPGGDTRLVLFRSQAPMAMEKITYIAFTADDVERTCVELKAKGVAFEGPVEHADWGSSATFMDSEGNTFVISSQ